MRDCIQKRGIVKIGGEDRFDFLQGLISNDIFKLKNVESIYACLLNAQGRYLHDFIIYEEGSTICLDCEAGPRAQDLAARLMKFKLRSAITIECDDNVSVCLNGAVGICDPRHPELGRREYYTDNTQSDCDDWQSLRISLCVPDGSNDLEVERTTMAEANMDALGALDWKKGCYVGQELTARMHHRNLGKKKLYPIEITDESFIGFEGLKSRQGNLAIAMLRDSDLEKYTNQIKVLPYDKAVDK